MFPNCIDRVGRQKKEPKVQQTKKENQEKNKQIKNGNNSTYLRTLNCS